MGRRAVELSYEHEPFLLAFINVLHFRKNGGTFLDNECLLTGIPIVLLENREKFNRNLLGRSFTSCYSVQDDRAAHGLVKYWARTRFPEKNACFQRPTPSPRTYGAVQNS